MRQKPDMRPYLPIAVAVFCASCAHDARTAPAHAPAEARAASESELRTGKRVYDLHCARCHGRDGKEDTYPFIATLDGIGKRMSLEEILEATWATGFVSERQFTDEEKRGLAVYVAAL